MTEQVLRLTYYGNNDRRFAAPTNFNHTFRETLQLLPKKAGDASVHNARSEFITNDVIVVTGGCTDPCKTSPRTEKVSIRTVISGSVENSAAMAQMVKDHLVNVTLALPDHLAGFMASSDIEFVVGSGTTE